MQSKLNEVYLIKLHGEVAARFGAPISTPRDFETLADAIFTATGSSLSPSTLKRLWGYVKDTPRKHTSTLDILARYAGYQQGFNEFMEKMDAGSESESGFDKKRTLSVFTLQPGDCVEIKWLPDRCALLKYSGDCTFLVEKAENAKLSSGNRVKCSGFIDGKRLILDVVDADGKSDCIYEAGKINGISWRLLKGGD